MAICNLRNREEETNGDWFYNWTESFKVVDIRALMKPFGKKTSFVFLNGVLEVVFNTKHPFTTNNISSFRGRDK